ncbi:MAG: DUF554 domain-containing protein [Bacillota bacterium]
MLGNYVNAIAIIVGTLIGLLIHKGLKDDYKNTMMQAIGLSVLFIGAATALNGLLDPESEAILFILSLVIGGIVGEMLGLDNALTRLGQFLQNRVGKGDHNVSRGFVTASLIFCVGTMAIIGSLESGLRNNYDMLFAKSILDGVTSLILATTLGIGVAFSAAAVFIYQGAIIIFAGTLEPILTIQVIREISIIGGILIFAIGLNMLEMIKVKTVNLLPAVLVPVFYYFVVLPLYKNVL